MQIQIDSREKARAIRKITEEFDRQNIDYFISKLYVGDYMNLDNPRVIVDRKQNLTELCSNLCQGHERFRAEAVRALNHDIHLVVLCEHGKNIKCMNDVIWWDNPRRHKRQKNPQTGRWETHETNATTGPVLYKIMRTFSNKYGCEFLFCNKNETGRRIIEILSERS